MEVHSLELCCRADQVDELMAEFSEAGTLGVREMEEADGCVRLIAGFAQADGSELLHRFVAFRPQWRKEEPTDWVEHTQQQWPGRTVGQRFFICPPWNTEKTPAGRIRLIQNPGVASGTGEHPCTQLAIEALENADVGNARVADVGTGSGILALAARQLGAAEAIGLDPDEEALSTAAENFLLNGQELRLAVGSADALKTGWADITVANISGTVLFAITDDLLRCTRPGGTLVFTGFTEGELRAFERLLPVRRVFESGEWRCIVVTNPAYAD
jgi:ribosomal protein L11 methyltransferase